MKRKLVFVVALFGLAVFGANKNAAATYPLCSDSYCPSNPDEFCTCPYGMPFGGRYVYCDGWRPDCNLV